MRATGSVSTTSTSSPSSGTASPATMTDQPMTTRPHAPGKLGEAIEPALIQRYLDELDSWLRTRQDELDELDRAALAANRGQELAGDMGLVAGDVEGDPRPLPAGLRDLGRRPGAAAGAGADLDPHLGAAGRRVRHAGRARGVAARRRAGSTTRSRVSCAPSWRCSYDATEQVARIRAAARPAGADPRPGRAGAATTRDQAVNTLAGLMAAARADHRPRRARCRCRRHAGAARGGGDDLRTRPHRRQRPPPRRPLEGALGSRAARRPRGARAGAREARAPMRRDRRHGAAATPCPTSTRSARCR